MTNHICARCGLESRRTRDSWPERHSVAAAVFAVPALYLLVAVMLAYWWFTIPVTVIVCAALLNRATRRRAAIAARADWEYRQAMLRAVRSYPGPMRPVAVPRRVAKRPWHVMTHWPTTPIRTIGVPR